ncbi:ankyrin repeat domain-containing protein [Armatimonas rosea]|uniref:Ankyrin repeat protein n=1 Tax=Armatimonas rosea TaxID=685828 RepID=A0A7W9W7E0_ARMRO|nr:ankyrin repeat domain-containing protein [Armatimonas rosea]MBB6052369.1 ankyrin repeat protein [Armatimonas rosea]
MQHTRGKFAILLSLIVCLVCLGAGWAVRRELAQRALNRTLVEAARRDDLRGVRAALQRGASPNTRATYQNQVTSLPDVWKWLRHDEELFWHDAPLIGEVAENGGKNDEAILKALLDAGADVNSCDNLQRTALMGAAGGDRVPLVRLLLRYGADRSLVSRRGWTALDEAKEYNRTRILPLLR